MMKKQVQIFVRDEPHIITVSRKFEARWVAHGVYLGKSLSVEDRTEDGAMRRWRTIAESSDAPGAPT